MFFKKKKISARRQHVRDNISAEKFTRLSGFINSPFPTALFILTLFIILVIAILALDTSDGQVFRPDAKFFKPYREVIALGTVVILVCLGAAIYINHYQNRIISRPTRLTALAGLFLILLVITKIGSLAPEWIFLATGSAVISAIILTIAYNQRFAIGITLFYCILASFAVGKIATVELFLTMMAGVVTCCFSLREIRTRMKIIEVTTMACVAVGITAAALGAIQGRDMRQISYSSGAAAAITIAVGLVIQGFLPIIVRRASRGRPPRHEMHLCNLWREPPRSV